MGRKARLRQDRNMPSSWHVCLAPANDSDEYTQSDRAWFEGSTECIRFRPEIEGEFDKQQKLGYTPPYINLHVNGKECESPSWVCVVEVSRLSSGKTLGVRRRMRCPAPINGKCRKIMADYALEKTRLCLDDLRSSGGKSQ